MDVFVVSYSGSGVSSTMVCMLVCHANSAACASGMYDMIQGDSSLFSMRATIESCSGLCIGELWI